MNVQMAQDQLNIFDVLGKLPSGIPRAHVKANHFLPIAPRCHQHGSLSVQSRCGTRPIWGPLLIFPGYAGESCVRTITWGSDPANSLFLG
jgi:hypothetical protein